MITRTFVNGIPIDTQPCNWCGYLVQCNEDGHPITGQWKDYPDYFAVYCSTECSVREYDYLYQHNPESLAVCLPVPDHWHEMMVNH